MSPAKRYSLAYAALSLVLGGVSIAQTSTGQRQTVSLEADGLHRLVERQASIPTTVGASPAAPLASGIVWFLDDASAVAETVGFSESTNSAWVAQDLNNQRLLRFDIDGTSTPTVNIPRAVNSEFVLAAAQEGDLVVAVTETTAVTLEAFNAAGVSQWPFSVPSPYVDILAEVTAVSRDGSTVCCAVKDPAAPGGGEATRLFILDGATGGVINTWDYPDRVHGVDVNDDGSLCLVTQAANGRLIDTATGTEIATGSVTGQGGFGKISGAGNVFVLGGFNLRVYIKSGASYVLWMNFNPGNEFFSEVAVSRDGSTVVAISSDFTFKNTITRAWDVASKGLLGSHSTIGTGSYQDSPSGAAVSADGSILAVSSWGTQNNDHPEVMVFDRNVNLIGSVDTPGSALWMDLTGDGQFVLVGSKAVHANALGSGGRATCYRVFSPPAITAAVSRGYHGGDADFDIDLLAAGAVECRTSEPMTLVVGFDTNIQLATGTGADVSVSSGSVSSLAAAGAELTIELNRASNTQPLTVGFPGVKDAGGNSTNQSLCFAVLAGDVNADKAVNVLDLVQVRNALNQSASAGNFRADVNTDGGINVLDLVAVRNRLNTSLSGACP